MGNRTSAIVTACAFLLSLPLIANAAGPPPPVGPYVLPHDVGFTGGLSTGEDYIWLGAPALPNPDGSIWINFESTAGAGDMAHFGIFPNPAGPALPTFNVFAEFHGVFPWDAPFEDTNPPGIYLTEMGGVPIDHAKYDLVVSTAPEDSSFLDFDVFVYEPFFMHDLHFECFDGGPCDGTYNMGIRSLSLASYTGPFETGVWVVPVPAAIWLLGSTFAGVVLTRRKTPAAFSR